MTKKSIHEKFPWLKEVAAKKQTEYRQNTIQELSSLIADLVYDQDNGNQINETKFQAVTRIIELIKQPDDEIAIIVSKHSCTAGLYARTVIKKRWQVDEIENTIKKCSSCWDEYRIAFKIYG